MLEHVICRQYTFEAAHVLKDYKGPCCNVHGHSYKLEVFVTGRLTEERDKLPTGMVMDFTILDKMVKEIILDKYDHALIIDKANIELVEKLKDLQFKIVVMDSSPTVENMCFAFYYALYEEVPRLGLPNVCRIVSIRVWETADSYAQFPYRKDL